MLPNFNTQTLAALEDSSSPRRENMGICTCICMYALSIDAKAFICILSYNAPEPHFCD